MELFIKSPDFDFISYTNQIEIFGNKNEVPKKIIDKLILLFEEICVTILLPRLGKTPKIRVTIEYSAQEVAAYMLIDYNGEQFNIEDSDDDISLMIIKKRASQIEYRAELEEEFLNHLKLHIKN